METSLAFRKAFRAFEKEPPIPIRFQASLFREKIANEFAPDLLYSKPPIPGWKLSSLENPSCLMTWWHGFSLFVQNHRTKQKQPKCFRHVSMYCYFRWFFSPTKCFESQNHWFGQHLISATMWPLEGKNSAQLWRSLHLLLEIRIEQCSNSVPSKRHSVIPGWIQIEQIPGQNC